MIDTIAMFFGELISFIYKYVPNFGAAIIIMTIMVKLVTFPLNNKQIQSAKRMQVLQPELKKIQQKYKDDKEKQNKAVSEFMKENNMNPLAGCLPLLVQFPILIGIFRLLQNAEEIISPLISNFSPYLLQLANTSRDINLLVAPLTSLSLENIISEISIYYLFPLIAGATTYFYSKMSMPADSSQKMMLYLMPAMITVFSFTFPVGLVIYWTMNNIFSIGQHMFIVHLDKAKENVAKEEKAEQNSPEQKNAEDKVKKTNRQKDAESNIKGATRETKPKAKKGKGKK